MPAIVDQIKQTTREGIQRVAAHVQGPEDYRVGVELKFPVVRCDGAAASRQQVDGLFEHLVSMGWSAQREGETLTGAATAGEQNDTVASCETGYCKAEFSMAHAGDLHAMAKQIETLRAVLSDYCRQAEIALIGYGIHPVTPPSRALKRRAARAGVWGRIFRSNQFMTPEAGDDVDLFTVNAANHVHVGVPADCAAKLVSVLNGYAPAQIALGANASVWRGGVDDDHASVAEAFWDWWQPAAGRVGMPERPFEELNDYIDYIASLPCLYVKRNGESIALESQPSLQQFVEQDTVPGVNLDGDTVPVGPQPQDVALHNSCYWYNARVSRYFTVENRVFDQQPPEALLAPAAMTLGLAVAADEAAEALAGYGWDDLRASRRVAYQSALRGSHDAPVNLQQLAAEAIELATTGLQRRGLGEEKYLQPFAQRLAARCCPADGAAALFEEQGAAALVEDRRWA